MDEVKTGDAHTRAQLSGRPEVAPQFVVLDPALVRAEFARRSQESRERIRAESCLRFHLRQLLLRLSGVLNRMAAAL
jgi:hypothetical protein